MERTFIDDPPVVPPRAAGTRWWQAGWRGLSAGSRGVLWVVGGLGLLWLLGYLLAVPLHRKAYPMPDAMHVRRAPGGPIGVWYIARDAETGVTLTGYRVRNFPNRCAPDILLQPDSLIHDLTWEVGAAWWKWLSVDWLYVATDHGKVVDTDGTEWRVFRRAAR